jgi:integrase
MLTDAKIRAIRPGPSPFKISDSGGLHLLVSPAGGKLWKCSYRFAGRQKTLSFGAYPDVSLAEARTRREEAKAELRLQRDPGVIVQAEKRAVANTFAAVAKQWWQKKMVAEKKSESTLSRARGQLKTLNAGIGDRPIAEIEAPELLDVLRRVEARGKHETAKRLRATAEAIFRFGIASGACRRNPAADLKGALTAVKSTPIAAIVDPAGVGELLRAIDGYERPVLRMALQLLALTFVRPGNVCAAEWSEFDVGAGVWSIPAGKMKMREPFRVPLSRQALAVLKELHAVTGGGKYLFPALRAGSPRPLYTYNLNNVGLRGMGFAADRMRAHGFRSTASTLLNEYSEFSPDVIELSLAHVPRGVRAIYNRSKYWNARCDLVQWYADHLDELRRRGEIVALPARKSTRKAGA